MSDEDDDEDDDFFDAIDEHVTTKEFNVILPPERGHRWGPFTSDN